jgi:hypothetical protein
MIPKMEKRRVIQKMKNKMIGIAAVLLIALMLAGVSYALWSKILYIDGTVKMGNVDAEIIAGRSWDTEIEGKDVSSISCSVDTGTGHLIVTVNNAYPCIDYYQAFSIHCTGSIPVKVQNITLVSNTIPANGVVEIIPDIGEGKDPDMKVGVQLDYCEYAYGVVHVHLDNDATQGATYTFSFEIFLVQWNEYVS